MCRRRCSTRSWRSGRTCSSTGWRTNCRTISSTPILNQAHVYQIGASRQVIAPHFQVADALLERMPNLVAVSSNGAGYDTVDVDACTRQGIAVVNQSGGNKEGVAEHALAMMLTLSKRIIETDRRMRAGPDIPRNQYIGRELLNRTVGVIGIGNVGGRVAELCRGLFNMRVLAYDPYLTAAQIKARGAEKVELDDLLRAADFVSVHCPLTRELRGMMGAAQFALMRPDAWFITTARGFIHDERALADALAAKQIAGAGLDVWEDEPPPHDHPLLKFDNVLVSPHTAGATEELRENMARFAAEQVLEILDGKRPPRLVNPEVWPAYRERFAQIMGFAVRRIERATMDDVELVAYDPGLAAPVRGGGRTAARGARSALVIGIEHFGSTAVPGLIAKPIIDILMCRAFAGACQGGSASRRSCRSATCIGRTIRSRTACSSSRACRPMARGARTTCISPNRGRNVAAAPGVPRLPAVRPDEAERLRRAEARPGAALCDGPRGLYRGEDDYVTGGIPRMGLTPCTPTTGFIDPRGCSATIRARGRRSAAAAIGCAASTSACQPLDPTPAVVGRRQSEQLRCRSLPGSDDAEQVRQDPCRMSSVTRFCSK